MIISYRNEGKNNTVLDKESDSNQYKTNVKIKQNTKTEAIPPLTKSKPEISKIKKIKKIKQQVYI